MTDQATFDYRYWAFISYSSKDAAQAKWLHRAIETYGIPAKMVPHGHATPVGEPAPRRFQPIFRDRAELPASADLGQAIGDALAASRYLIVVCSPAAAQSRWVNREIETFTALGRGDRIFACIVDGKPNGGDEHECFPPALRQREPLAADARRQADGKNDARLKLLAGMLGVGFDALKQRDAQRRIRRLQLAVGVVLLLALAFGGLAWYANQARQRAVVAEGNAVTESHVRATAEANAISESHVRATAEANAVSEAQARATAQAVAEQERNIAVARQLAAQAQTVEKSSGELDTAILLATESMRRYVNPDASLFLQRSLDQLMAPLLRLNFTSVITDAVFFELGDRVAVTTADQLIHVIELPGGAQTVTVTPETPVRTLTSCNGSSQLLAIETTQAELWTLTDIHPVQHIPIPAGQTTVHVDAGCHWMVIMSPADLQQRLQFWDIQQGRLIGEATSETIYSEVGFSPNGEWLLASTGNTVTLWRPDKAQIVGTLQMGGDVRGVTFSNGSKMAAIRHACGSQQAGNACPGISVVDLDQQGVVARLGEPGNSFEDLVFFGDDSFLLGVVGNSFRIDNRTLELFGSSRGTIRGNVPENPITVWRTDTWKPVAWGDIPASETAVYPDRPLALSMSESVMTVWDTTSGDPISQFATGSDTSGPRWARSDVPRWAIVISPSALEMWDVRTGTLVARSFPSNPIDGTYRVDPSNRYALALSPTAKSMVVWELTPRKRVALDALTDFPDLVQHVNFSPDSAWLVATHVYDRLDVWRLPSDPGTDGAPWRQLTETKETGFQFAISPDSRRVATYSESEGRVEIRELATGKIMSTAPLDGYPIGFTADGARLIAADNTQGEDTVAVWDLEATRELLRFSAPPLASYWALNDAGTRLAITQEKGDPIVRVYDLEQGKELVTSPGWRWALDASGRFLAVLADGSTMQLWDVDRNAKLAETDISDVRPVERLAFRGDSELLIAGSRFSVRSLPDLVETSSWKLGDVGWLDISPDGEWVFFVQSTGDAAIVDSHTGDLVASLWAPGAAYKVAFAPDGERLVVTATNGEKRVLLWKPESLIAEACSRLTRNLTKAEWEIYLPNETYRKTCPSFPEP